MKEEPLMHIALEAALAAGGKILEVYRGRNFRIRLKRDLSPITLADRLAHDAIMHILSPSGIPVLSEEGRNIPYDERKGWNRFWLVDPLDGTREFIKRNGEFTVNIALVEDRQPVAGVIFVPVNETLYFGVRGSGAWLWKGSEANDIQQVIDTATPLPFPQPERPYRLIASRSHLNRETTDFISCHLENHPGHEIVSWGSSLKLCMIAEGSADIYPRFGPTMEWDTAAGHAILEAAGGKVVHTDGSGPLHYNKPDLLNPWFIASR